MVALNRCSILTIRGLKPIHPFPARMAPSIVLDQLEGAKRPLRILDPMMGSGTVLALAQLDGHIAIGFDIDPLAVLISKTWTNPVDPIKIRKKANEILGKARFIFKNTLIRDAYPIHSDNETRAFIRFWFDNYARQQLSALAAAINRVSDESTRNVLWCGFSRLIITKKFGASLASDLSHSRPHKSFDRAPAKPFSNFIPAVDRVIENCIKTPNSFPTILCKSSSGDARNLPLENESIELVLTSPPYLNAIDYMRCSKFSLVWMGFNIKELRRIRADSIGALGNYDSTNNDKEIKRIISSLKLQPKLLKKDLGMLIRYIYDMRRAVDQVARVLVPGGKAVYVIGDNTIRGTRIRNSLILCKLAKLSGLNLLGKRFRMLPPNRRYLPPPEKVNANRFDGRMYREVILLFKKPEPD